MSNPQDYDYEQYDESQFEYPMQLEPQDQLQLLEASEEQTHYVQIIRPDLMQDGFDFLLAESNFAQIEQCLFQDPQRLYLRLGKLFNYMVNIIQMMSNADPMIMQEYSQSLDLAMQSFVHSCYMSEHSEFRSHLTKHIGVELNIDKSFLNSILSLFTSTETLDNNLKVYLPRILVFAVKPTQPFVGTMSYKTAQLHLLQRVEQLLFDDNFFAASKVDVIALLYFTDPRQNTSQFKQITNILSSFLESFLESSDYKEENQLSVLNLLQLLIALTTNDEIVGDMFTDNLHKILYKAIKFADPVFTMGQISKGWAREPIIVQAIVGLIIRIVSQDYLDTDFCQVLLEDFLFLIEHQKFEFLYQVLLPILNSENAHLIPLCFHSQMTLEEMRNHINLFLKNQSQTMAMNLRLQSDMLSFNQRVSVGQLVQQFQHKKKQPIPAPQQPIKSPVKPIKQNKYSQFQEEMEQEEQILENQEQVLPFQQIEVEDPTIVEEVIETTKGNWLHLHSFSTNNPQFDFRTVAKALDKMSNALFIFDIMCGSECVKLVAFLEYLIHDQKGNNYVQGKSNEKSFYSMLIQDKMCWTVPVGGDGKQQYIALDIQQHMLQISYHTTPIACINFQDVYKSKFGFPFEQLTDAGLLQDQIKAAMMSEETYLLGCEIWSYDAHKDHTLTSFDMQMSQFTNKSYNDQLNYYLSQFRLDKIYLVSDKATIADINQALTENIDDTLLRRHVINDLYVLKPVKELKLPIKSTKYLLKQFQQQIGGLEYILQNLNKYSVQQHHPQDITNFFADLISLVELPNYSQYLIEQDGFIQLILAVVFLAKKNEGIIAFHKGVEQMYLALIHILKQSPKQIRSIAIVKSNIHVQIISRLSQYLDFTKVEQTEAPSLNQLFQQKQPQQAKGKPKGIGYGDITYSKGIVQEQQVVKPAKEENNLFGTKGTEFKQTNAVLLFQSLHQLLDCEYDQNTYLSVTTSKIISTLINYFKSVNITSVESSVVFKEVLALVRLIASKECLLNQFVINDGLYKCLEGLYQQAAIFSRAFQSINEDIQLFNEVVEYVESSLVAADLLEVQYKQQGESVKLDLNLKIHQFYRLFMKPLAVGKCEGIQADPDYLAKMGTCLAACSKQPPQAKMQRILQEITTIDENLPLEGTNSIFIRYDADRMDCMRTMIFGASGTPYAHGAFLYEMLFGDDYPKRPPKVLLQTTGHGKVRFNPNLYNCGKVCLSLLGTWGDNWIADFSTILQILVSIQSMVMSEYVMFNEPGWESQMGTPDGEAKNRGYCNFVKIQNIRYAMIESLQKPPKGFEDVIKKSFFLRKELICAEIEQWIKDAALPANYNQTQNQCVYQTKPEQYKIDLMQLYEELKVELNKLKLNIGSDFVQLQGNSTVKETKCKPTDGRFIQRMMPKPLQLPEGNSLDGIDISYDNFNQQRAFDPNDQNVQNLMSRYIGVLGVEAVQKQSDATVLIDTLNALGIEIAKNVILSGVKRVVIHDDTIVSDIDLCGQFYLTVGDIGTTRSLACLNKLKHLNPYVIIEYITGPIANYQYTVIVTQDVEVAQRASRKAYTVLAQTRGIFSRIVTDFGVDFQILDVDGEAASEMQIENIEGNVVTLFKNSNHNLQDGDTVIFQEIQEQGDGTSWNGQLVQVGNVGRNSFQIDVRGCKQYISNGVAYQQKKRISTSYQPIEQILNSLTNYADSMGYCADVDQYKRDIIHILMNNQPLAPWSLQSFEQYVKLARQLNIREILKRRYNEDVFLNNEAVLIPIICLMSMNAEIPPLSAYVGGLASQEVFKAITKKYSPITQVYVDWREDLLPFKLKELDAVTINPNTNAIQCNQPQFDAFVLKYGFQNPTDPRYRLLQYAIGANALQAIQQAQVFTVGAGAIGCELLKNYAMCGIGIQGRLYLTDPDIIENSNLNRQFLFREKHIRKPKSLTAAAVACSMNPQLNNRIIARLDRVGPDSLDIYNTLFYKQIHCVANALDNVQARLFVDQMCVQNERPLLESGTLGSKGHVQVIIPHVTENYANRQDPEQNDDIPYCTLKMFPESILHCLEWGRDKFEQYFVRKPSALQAILSAQDLNSLQQQTLELGLKVLRKLPQTFQDCVVQGRLKYQKLFNGAIHALLTAYPLDCRTKEGKLFWSAPKRTPNAIPFGGFWAIQFVEDYALLTAQLYEIAIPQQYDIRELVAGVIIPEQSISKDKLKQMQQQVEKNGMQVEEESEIKDINQLIEETRILIQQKQPKVSGVQQFEKDDDNNHHVSFVAAATNGRGLNYGMNQVDWMWVKLKAGRIVPAMATTTSCISGLQTLELIKILSKSGDPRNTFMNSATSFMMVSEPGECAKIKINGNDNTVWSKVGITLPKLNEPLQYLIKSINSAVNGSVITLQYGNKPIYVEQLVPKGDQDRCTYLNTPLNRLVELDLQIGYIDMDCRVLSDAQEHNIKVRIHLQL